MEEIDLFLDSDDSMPPSIENDDYDSEGDIRFLEELLSNNSPPLPENELFSLDQFDDPSLPSPPPEQPAVEISLNFEPHAPVINNFDELNEDECFDPGGGEINVSQNVEEDDSFTFFIRTFLPFLTNPEDSPLLLSSGSEDTIFDHGFSTFHFSSLKPVAYENPMVIFLFFCFCPNDKGIRGEIPQDHEDPCLFSILQSSGLRSSAYIGILNPDLVKMIENEAKTGNSQVKDNKIDLLVQQYEQINILEDETIDSGFAHFNTIITSLKALDESFGSKNFVRKLLRALIENLKVYKMIMKKDSEIIKGKRYKLQSIALKAKMESSDDEESSSNSEDKDY
ncbi:hypothetical protein Tco_0634880 [Tanacetum coccineum]